MFTSDNFNDYTMYDQIQELKKIVNQLRGQLNLEQCYRKELQKYVGIQNHRLYLESKAKEVS